MVNHILQLNKKKNKIDIIPVMVYNMTNETNPEIVRSFIYHFSIDVSRIDNFLQAQYLSNFTTKNSHSFYETTNFELENIRMSHPHKSSQISTYSIKVIKCVSNLISLILAIIMIKRSLYALENSIIPILCKKLRKSSFQSVVYFYFKMT